MSDLRKSSSQLTSTTFAETTCELLFAGPILVKISKETEFGEAICFGGIITTNLDDQENLRDFINFVVKKKGVI